MAFALNDAFNACLHTLISADMAPSIGKISPEYFYTFALDLFTFSLRIFPFLRFAAYAKGMQEIEEAKVKTKSEGDKVLQAYEKAGPASSRSGPTLRSTNGPALKVIADKAIPLNQRHHRPG